jgi:hypothetical protein
VTGFTHPNRNRIIKLKRKLEGAEKKWVMEKPIYSKL